MREGAFINRDISWLHFNYRVLQEAMDENVPLLERIKFLGIYSNNRDEFFRVRVANLKRLIPVESKLFKENNEKPTLVLDEIADTIEEQEKDFNKTYNKLFKELKKRKIYNLKEDELDKDQQEYIKDYYYNKLRRYLFPINLRHIHSVNSIKDGTVYFAVELKHHDQIDYALVKIPSKETPRIIKFPIKDRKNYFMFLDDAIRFNLREIFFTKDYKEINAYIVKVTRDAELDFDEDVSKSFFEQMQDSLQKRKKGLPVRFVYDKSMPDEMLKVVLEKLKISKNDYKRGGGRYHNLKDLMDIPVFSKKYVYKKKKPLVHRDLAKNKDVFEVLRNRNILLHFPYHSFDHIIDFLRQASYDKYVTRIQITLYRLSSYSNVINALVNAARNSKRVEVLLEVQARFDEEANLNLVRKLQNENVRIISPIKNFKTHSKIVLVTRKIGGKTEYYSHIGTGNLNETTAKLYTDTSYLTSDEQTGKELSKVFKFFEYRFTDRKFEKLLVSPINTREKYCEFIDREIENKKQGKNAWIIVKINSLSDTAMTEKLYEASNAGVKIDLIVRGICILIPGIKNLSENIRVISIVDKYLEHSRVFAFCNNNKNRLFLGSADWMVRNLDNRLEVATEITDKKISKELLEFLKIQLRDNVKARENIKGKYSYKKRKKSDKKHRSQVELYGFYRRM